MSPVIGMSHSTICVNVDSVLVVWAPAGGAVPSRAAVKLNARVPGFNCLFCVVVIVIFSALRPLDGCRACRPDEMDRLHMAAWPEWGAAAKTDNAAGFAHGHVAGLRLARRSSGLALLHAVTHDCR